jgi:hypothetical protein
VELVGLAAQKSPEIFKPQIPVGQLSNGPAGEASSMGVLCHLPKAAVAYPLSVKILAMDGVL